MAKLNTRQEHRWAAAQRLVFALKLIAKQEQAILLFDGELLELTAIRMNDRGIYVVAENCTYIVFEADPEVDHGLYDKAKDFETEFRKRFVLVKKLVY